MHFFCAKSCIYAKKAVLLYPNLNYGTITAIFIRCDGRQFPLLRLGVGADVNIA